MLSPKDPVDIDTQPTDLAYWLRRAAAKNRRASEYYAVYQGCELVLHPYRAAMVKFDGRRILVNDPDKYKGRGWLVRLTEDVEKAIKEIKAGGGEVPEPSYGDRIRAEIKMRAAGERTKAEHRKEWFEWLQDDELPLLFGTWLHHAGIVSGRFEISRRPVIDFHIENEEFDMASLAMSSANLRVTLNRLAIARGAPPA